VAERRCCSAFGGAATTTNAEEIREFALALSRPTGAVVEGWRGEIEGIDLMLRLFEEKIRNTDNTRAKTVYLAMPALP